MSDFFFSLLNSTITGNFSIKNSIPRFYALDPFFPFQWKINRRVENDGSMAKIFQVLGLIYRKEMQSQAIV